jgi:energy-coupling factor transporter ATP-binding protein EcfA2
LKDLIYILVKLPVNGLGNFLSNASVYAQAQCTFTFKIIACQFQFARSSTNLCNWAFSSKTNRPRVSSPINLPPQDFQFKNKMMTAQQNMLGCIICDQNIWIDELNANNQQWEKLSFETSLDDALAPIQSFQYLISKFTSMCGNCLNVPLVALMGRTGSGKSTLMNILAGCKPSYGKGALGTKEIYFEDGVCDVGGGISSLTKFCYAHRIDDAIYVDFAGFFDNRAGQLQVVQHLLLHRVTKGRWFKIIAVKDIRTTRDVPFFDFLNLDWINAKNTLVVMTHTISENEVDWDKYGEGLIQEKFKVVMMPLAVKGFSYQTFKYNLRKKIKDLKFSDAEIAMPISSDVYQFQGEALKVLKSKIDVEFKSILEKVLRTLTVQPYDVEYYRRLFSEQFSILQALAALKEANIVTEQTDTRALEKYANQWALLAGLSSDKFADLQNWGQISPSSNELIGRFHEKLNTFSAPDFLPFEGSDLVADLLAWNDLSHTHYIEHVAFRARALFLIAQDDENSFKELQRLAKYRQDTYRKIMKVWEPLELRFLKEIDQDGTGPSGQFLKTMRMKDAKGVLHEILKFSNSNRDDVAYLAKVMAHRLSGVALADGAIATSAWLAKMVSTAASGGGAVESALGSTITTTGVVFGLAGTAALGAFAYHLYLTNRQLQKVRAIGFDLYYIDNLVLFCELSHLFGQTLKNVRESKMAKEWQKHFCHLSENSGYSCTLQVKELSKQSLN